MAQLNHSRRYRNSGGGKRREEHFVVHSLLVDLPNFWCSSPRGWTEWSKRDPLRTSRGLSDRRPRPYWRTEWTEVSSRYRCHPQSGKSETSPEVAGPTPPRPRHLVPLVQQVYSDRVGRLF